MYALAILVVVSVAVVAYIARTVQQYLALKQFSGPPAAGFTRLWLLQANTSGEMNKVFTQVNDQYGK